MRLSARLSLLIFGTIAILSLATIFSVNHSLNQHVINGQQAWVKRLTRSITEGVVDNTLYRNAHVVQQQLQNIAKDDTIEYVYVSDFDGLLFAHSFQGAFPEYLAKALERDQNNKSTVQKSHYHEYQTPAGTIFEFNEPLIPGKNATLFIGINQKNIRALLLTSFKSILWPTLIIGLAGLLVALIIGHRMSKPLHALSDSIQRYGKGDASSPIEMKTSDPDIKQLVDAFREMTAARAIAERERHDAEEQLRNVQQKLHLHFQQTPLGVIEWDTDFRVVNWNPAAQQIFGYSREEALGQHASELIVPPEVIPHVDTIWNALLKHKGGNRSTNENITRDGNIIMCEWYNTPLIADDGKVIGVASLVDDVTDRVQAKLELERHRDHLAELVAERATEVQEQARMLDQIHDSVIATDLDGIVTSWNHGALQLFGYSKEEALGRHIAFVYPEEELAILEKLLRILKDYGEHEQEVKMRKKNGEQFYAQLSLSMLYNEDGTQRGMIGYSTDITERKLAQEELKQQKQKLEITNKELEAFSYSVSHDLRAPLRALHGFSQALQEDYEDKLDAEGKDYLQRIQANALRMSELIDDLLKLSRLGREQLTVMPVDLHRLIHDAMESQRSDFPGRQIEFQLHLDSRVYGDPRLLRLAVENLINNALKYTTNTPRAQIEFGRTEQDGETVYYIRDNGSGFNMQYADKLFGVFQRLHGADYEGTGIGLATVRRIIQRHDGRIWAEAQPGKGATFYFTLGLTRDAAEHDGAPRLKR